MSPAIVALCLAAFGAVTLVASGAVVLGRQVLERAAEGVSPRQATAIWLGAALLPGFSGVLALGVAFLPALGIGHDHCLSHAPHHPHLCLTHAAGAPGLAVLVIAGLLALRFAVALAAATRRARLAGRTARALGLVAEARQDVLTFPGTEPQAFVLGALRPQLHASKALWGLGPRVVDAVLAHERAHVRHRDLLWRAVATAGVVLHLPGVGWAILGRLAEAQERAADAAAAAAVPGGAVAVAEALVALARRATSPMPGLSFTEGDVQRRVQALLREPAPRARWLPRLLTAAIALGAAAALAAHDLVHHALETLLGALS